MGVDAQYVVRFASAEAAETALSNMGSLSTRSVNPGGEKPSYDLHFGDVTLIAQQDSENPEMVWVSSWSRHLNPDLFLWSQTRWWKAQRLDVSRGMTILEELDFLLSVPGLRSGAIYYGSDLMAMREINILVDVNFLASLQRFVTENRSLLTA